MRVFRRIFAIAVLTIYIKPVLVFAAGMFEDFPISPRVLSMGGAAVALSDDASSSVCSNPAGMPQCQRTEINSSYADLYGADGLYVGSISGVLPTGGGTAWGVGWQRLELPSVYYENIITLAFARQLSDYFSVGFSVKDLRSGVSGFSAPLNDVKLAAFDAGVMWQMNDDWMAGCVFERINEPRLAGYYGGAEQILSPRQRAGIKYQPFESGIVVAEYLFNQNEISAGFEVVVGKMLPLRIGVNRGRLTFGAGVEIANLGGVDFAMLTDANLGNLYYGGFKFRL